MTETACDAVAPDLPEYALGLLAPGVAARVAVHIETCGHCRDEVAAFADLGSRLLDLVPDADTPIGLDRRILAGLPAHSRSRRPLAVVAAALLAAAVTLGVLLATDHSHPPGPANDVLAVDSPLIAGGHEVGHVTIGGHPEEVTMQVEGLSGSAAVSCVLVMRSGATLPIGSFGLYHGGGSWSVPTDAAPGQLAGARLVSSSGTVLATATFDGPQGG